MKKAFDQTVRDLKREVNKKVLKVPSIEQKVLDATSNEPWGPHGSHLADIAQATRNYHEYQMIMSVIWKRINDTGKNWRHVYKALTVLEYLVAHGSERVIDEIREHAYQISTLSDFQYIDSSGRDQGSNVRRKSQSLVVLVNDKERIQEVRQKAAANRDKYRNTSMGGMHKSGSYSNSGGYGDRYDDDRYEGRYGSRDEEHNGYGRDREWGSKDDDRYGRYGDSYSRDGDRYGRDYEDRYSYRDDDYQGRSRSADDYQYGSRSRSSDRDRDQAYEDDGQYSSRGSGAKADDQSQDGSFGGRQLDRKFSEQNLGAPPSYEEVVVEARSPVHSERDGEISAASARKLPSPHTTTPGTTPPAPAAPAPAAPAPAPAPASSEVYGFDEFDPRGSFSGAPTTSNNAEMDLLGSLSESFSSNPLAIIPVTSTTSNSDADASANTSSGPTFVATQSASTASNQAFEDPFGDGPFQAISSTDGVPAQPQNIASTSSLQPNTNQCAEPPQPVAQVEAVNNLDLGGSFPGMTYTASSASNAEVVSANPQYSHQELSTPDPSIDILADILPPSGPSPSLASQAAFPVPTGQPALQTGFPTQTGQPPSHMGFQAQIRQPVSPNGFPSQPGQLSSQTSFSVGTGQPVSQTGFLAQTGQPASLSGFPAQAAQPISQTGFPPQSGQPASPSFPTVHAAQPVPYMGFPSQSGQPASTSFPTQMGPVSQAGFPVPSGQPAQPNANFYRSFHPHSGSTGPVVTYMASQSPRGPAAQHNTANFLQQSASPFASQMALQTPQAEPSSSMASQPALPASTGSFAVVPQPAKDKFETKSTVWTDTLSRGLVNLNISGPKTNPLADIGVDFDAINRKEKRMEKPTTTTVTSNITMGRAMGSGSGIGRAGAGALRPPASPMMGSGVGMGMGGGPSAGIGMGGYGVNQPMGMGMGMNMPVNTGMGMNMGMGQGVQMQPPTGFSPGSTMPGGYNPMMGTGGYGHQPYGGGYR